MAGIFEVVPPFVHFYINLQLYFRSLLLTAPDQDSDLGLFFHQYLHQNSHNYVNQVYFSIVSTGKCSLLVFYLNFTWLEDIQLFWWQTALNWVSCNVYLKYKNCKASVLKRLSRSVSILRSIHDRALHWKCCMFQVKRFSSSMSRFFWELWRSFFHYSPNVKGTDYTRPLITFP